MLDQSLITVVQESHKDILKEQVDCYNVIISKQVKTMLQEVHKGCLKEQID